MSWRRHKSSRIKKDTLLVFARMIYADYRSRSRKKGIDFKISFEQFQTYIKRNCEYCGSVPNNEIKSSRLIYRGKILKYSGLDRKDNSKGYVVSNIVPCCKECNSIKGSLLSHEEMLSVASAIQNQRSSKRQQARLQLAQEPLARLVTILQRRKGTLP